MIDLSRESVLSLTDAVDHLPNRRGGKPVHVATIYRWAQRGCRGIRLEVLQIGGTSCTSLEALQRFCEALTVARTGEPAATRTPRQRKAAHERATKELESAGW